MGLQSVGELAINSQLWIVSDECSSGFVFTGAGRHESIVFAHPGVRSRTIVVNTFSKELAITGWRLGYFTAPPEIGSSGMRLRPMFDVPRVFEAVGRNTRARTTSLAGGIPPSWAQISRRTLMTCSSRPRR
ncbi:aminotransferase class I/II-fold pyridoxal phosphate-dependent enzyme [Bradyrhizobium huanghuaihaiense]|uniref:aminotransferase class I/II-fold pyridoxal phosphate-dependent enzyme n=1 Tax=Bradyrhizobium huanghuaihaiense TaxID=990078 RepID=UPI0021AA53B5|nr:aminotransferase class I/II-fold pyridoxal phosphate-dependent enzyme [Bradyrhizobium sp. CB3035]UWU81508.1 aminotransferase class I/II-fold pyridoxal phosphate-dependent enzyme [Bradyrhizobium sp. CB3035]